MFCRFWWETMVPSSDPWITHWTTWVTAHRWTPYGLGSLCKNIWRSLLPLKVYARMMYQASSDGTFTSHLYSGWCSLMIKKHRLKGIFLFNNYFLSVCSVVNALELKEHLNKQVKNLSAGLKRKVRVRLKYLCIIMFNYGTYCLNQAPDTR